MIPACKRYFVAEFDPYLGTFCIENLERNMEKLTVALSRREQELYKKYFNYNCVDAIQLALEYDLSNVIQQNRNIKYEIWNLSKDLQKTYYSSKIHYLYFYGKLAQIISMMSDTEFSNLILKIQFIIAKNLKVPVWKIRLPNLESLR